MEGVWGVRVGVGVGGGGGREERRVEDLDSLRLSRLGHLGVRFGVWEDDEDGDEDGEDGEDG